MAKISQRTFDDAVQENIIEFGMSSSEAKEETIKQFEAQGVNLSNIIKDLTLNEVTGIPILIECIAKLQSYISKDTFLEKHNLYDVLLLLKNECDLSVQHRIFAAQNGAYDVMIILISNELSNEVVEIDGLQATLVAMNKLLFNQPDIFDERLLLLIINILKDQTNINIIREVLSLMQKACKLHEMNRQKLIKAEIIKYLKPLVSHNNENIIKEVCSVFRHLVLDDDIRVDFGNAHEHAKLIAIEIITDLTKLLYKFHANTDLISDILLTMATITVRNEFCIMIEEAGGLSFTLEAMKEHTESEKLVRQGFKLLKALAGNDSVKSHIVEQGGAPIIATLLNDYKNNILVSKIGLGCISTLVLRMENNSKAFFEAGVSEMILEIMKIHCENGDIQRNGAWAIRNMVSRSRDQCDTFISQGAEDILNEALKAHGSVGQDIRSALRDLGCKVYLQEEWKGRAEKNISN